MLKRIKALEKDKENKILKEMSDDEKNQKMKPIVIIAPLKKYIRFRIRYELKKVFFKMKIIFMN